MTRQSVNTQGQAWISKVEGEVYRNGAGEIVDAYVWLTGHRGDVFVRAVRNGETLAGLVEKFERSGVTDQHCALNHAESELRGYVG